jgi:hypothetical protein
MASLCQVQAGHATFRAASVKASFHTAGHEPLMAYILLLLAS